MTKKELRLKNKKRIESLSITITGHINRIKEQKQIIKDAKNSIKMHKLLIKSAKLHAKLEELEK